MSHTIYAAFQDAVHAEKAAGALLDHGLKQEDLTILTNHSHQIASWHARQADPMRPELNEPSAGRLSVNQPETDALRGHGTGFGPGTQPGMGAGLGGERVDGGLQEIGEAFEGDPINEEYAREDFARRDAAAAGALETESVHWEQHPEEVAKHGITTTTGADAAAGAMAGAGIGLGVGALGALASLFIPGVGLVLGGGALATALAATAGATGAGAAAGAVTGYLKDQGIEERLVADYERVHRDGGVLLAVEVPSGPVTERTALETLEKYGGTQVQSTQRNTQGYLH